MATNWILGDAEVGVVVPTVAGFGFGATGLDDLAAGTLVVLAICVPVRRLIGLIGQVCSHQASQPSRVSRRYTKGAIYHD